jgi:hypothetical protein
MACPLSLFRRLSSSYLPPRPLPLLLRDELLLELLVEVELLPRELLLELPRTLDVLLGRVVVVVDVDEALFERPLPLLLELLLLLFVVVVVVPLGRVVEVAELWRLDELLVVVVVPLFLLLDTRLLLLRLELF